MVCFFLAGVPPYKSKYTTQCQRLYARFVCHATPCNLLIPTNPVKGYKEFVLDALELFAVRPSPRSQHASCKAFASHRPQAGLLSPPPAFVPIFRPCKTLKRSPSLGTCEILNLFPSPLRRSTSLLIAAFRPGPLRHLTVPSGVILHGHATRSDHQVQQKKKRGQNCYSSLDGAGREMSRFVFVSRLFFFLSPTRFFFPLGRGNGTDRQREVAARQFSYSLMYTCLSGGGNPVHVSTCTGTGTLLLPL
ncbi:hypothetical protein GGI35DRAFT_293617 [Trichoderma velutinum]